MKKLIAFILAFIIMMSLSGLPYHKKCKKCIEERKTNKTCMCDIGVSWRDFGTPIIHKDGKAYATYRCCYGHSFLVCLSD